MFEASGGQELELTTRGGCVIKVKPLRRSCIVYVSNQPEVIQGLRAESMEQPVPFVVFIGQTFRLGLPAGRIELVDNRKGRLAIPYHAGPAGALRNLNISCASRADQYPVQVQHYPGVRQFLAREGEGHPYRYIVVEADAPRIDMVTLKVKNPEARILILREESPRPEKPPTAAELDSERLRATDLVRAGKGREFSSNPVFNARIHLRNMNLEQVRSLLVDYPMSAEELQFIRTFIGIMIRNEHGKAELTRVQDDLRRLDELYRLSGIVISGDADAFEAEVDRGVNPLIAADLIRLIAQRRSRATSKEDEIRYWEWEYRLSRGGAH